MNLLAQSDWNWVTNQGLAVGMLIAIGLGLWRAVSWTGTNVVLPMKVSAINHLNETNRSMEVNSEAINVLTTTITNIHADIKEIKSGINCKYRRDL